MSVTLRSLTDTTYAIRTNTTLTAPAGLTDGDIMLLICALGDNPPPAPTQPTGFTLLPNMPSTANNASFTVKTYVWYKIAASEAGSYTVTHASTNSHGILLAYSGGNANSFNPSPTTNTSTGTTTTFTGLTTKAKNTTILVIGQDWADTTNNLTAPTGSTPTFTEQYDKAATQSSLLYLADGTMTDAGAATGNKTMTNNSNSIDPWGGVMIAMNPATGSFQVKALRPHAFSPGLAR